MQRNCFRPVCLIEKELGRKREIRWGPRTLDLDILLYNQENIETEILIVPHPRMHERAFVIIPLNGIRSKYQTSEHECTFRRYCLNRLPDKEGVTIMEAEKWGRRIRAFRKLKGYTQEEFAKEIGVSVSFLGEVERGNQNPSEYFLQEVADMLQCFAGGTSAT